MKEIDQRNKNVMLIRCNCGSDHFLEIAFDADIDKCENTDEKTKNKTKKTQWKHYYISFIDQKDSFWYKLKDCWNYLFTQKGQICHSGIGITSKDMKKIIQHFKKYQLL